MARQETIRRLETFYAGCRFRSRLEARWAVFFDHLAINWSYEPQGWLLVGDDWPYLPDFLLPHQNLFYEVKGAPPEPGYTSLLERFAAAQGPLLARNRPAGRRVALAVGDIPRPDTHTVDNKPPFFIEMFYPDGWDNYQAWCMCDHCGAIDIQFEGRAERNCACRPDGRLYGSHHPDILDAYAAARSARFEHGESPSTR